MAKIINRTDFLKMPANTIYREYKPCIMGDLEIKGDSLENDFWVQRLDDTNTDDVEEMIKMLDSGVVEFDLECESRDAMFNDDQLYLVYERKDVEQLFNRISECLFVFGDVKMTYKKA